MSAEAEKYPPGHEPDPPRHDPHAPTGEPVARPGFPENECDVLESDPEGIDECRCFTKNGITTFAVRCPSGSWVQAGEGGIGPDGRTFFRVVDPLDGEAYEVRLACGGAV